jgi:phenylacetate-CoA ligase
VSAYNTILESAIMPVVDKIMRTGFIDNLCQWRNIDTLSNAKLKKIQHKNLKELLSFAIKEVPHYRDLDINLTGNPFYDLSHFPILYKKDIKSSPQSFLSCSPKYLIVEKSSGSSGIQGQVYITKKELYSSLAIQTHWWEWIGYHIGDPILQTGITPKRGFVKKCKDIFTRTRYFNAFDLSDADLFQEVGVLATGKFHFLCGYASSLYLIAKRAQENNMNEIYLNGAISWGDKMFPHYRKIIENQFHTKVMDTYGCSERFMIAAECNKGSFHIMTPHVVVELLNDNGLPVKPGELGKVVITRLDNRAMPLIRYYLGDLAEGFPDANHICDCGRAYPSLKRIIGRDTDIVKTASGKYMIVHFFTGLMEHFKEIKQFKVVQNNTEEIEIEYIPDIGFSLSILKAIEKKIHNHLNEPFPIIFKEVSNIPPSPSGKPQIISSNINGALR